MSASEKTADVSTLPHHLLLPEDILVEILYKLPAKSLLRFRCVSKFFCALMADHAFAIQYRSLSLTLPSRAGILLAIMHRTPLSAISLGYYTINFSKENPRGMLQANRVGYLDAEPFRRYPLLYSSEGLICLYTPNGDVYVCNVSTGQRISLPKIPIQFHSPPSSPCSALLGFDSESKRYKVLVSAPTFDQGGGRWRRSNKQWVLTVGVDKSWREINTYCSHLFYPFDGYGYPNYSHTSVYIDGVIYSYNWLTEDVDPPSFHIVAFDVRSESFSVIPFPDKVPSRYLSTDANRQLEVHDCSEYVCRNLALLEVDGGRLAIVIVHKIGRLSYLDVWTWEKLSKECFWGKITLTIPLLEEITINRNVTTFLPFTDHAGEIVLLHINNKQLITILVCNLKGEVWRKFDVLGVEEFPILPPRGVGMYRTMDNVFSLE